MKGRVLVMCASRNRPGLLRDMIKSVHKTSESADVAIYLDDDQTELYGEVKNAQVVTGPRIGQCKALEMLVGMFPGYEAYGAATDDSTFETPNWDEWVLKHSQGVRAISPYSGTTDRMDFPWLTRGWIEAAGRFVPLDTEHFYWDVVLELVAQTVGIAYATAKEFRMGHIGIMPEPEPPSEKVSDYQLRIIRSHTDGRESMRWLAMERREFIAKLKAAM